MALFLKLNYPSASQNHEAVYAFNGIVVLTKKCKIITKQILNVVRAEHQSTVADSVLLHVCEH